MSSAWLVNAAANSAAALLSIVNVVAAQAGLLEIALLAQLVHPVDLFIRVLGYFAPSVADD